MAYSCHPDREEGAVKDLHKGETCLIIGNGPSLRDIPLSLLNKYPSFGTNRIYLLDGFTPTYYACINPLVLDQSIEQIEAMNATKFVRFTHAPKITGSYALFSAYIPLFSKDPLKYVFEGHTVTYVCMQLAYWMGFTTALLVGVDHRFKFDGKPNEQVTAHGEDPNHFSPEYFGNGVTWNNPDLKNSEKAYRMAKLNYEKDGRKIINLTPDTALDIFDREDWQSWI